MADKPVTLPRWADNQSDPEADLTEPLSSKKDEGWLNGEKPAAGYMNWWMNLAYLWLAYLDDLEAQDFNWTGDHIFETYVTMYAGLLVSAGDVTIDDDLICGANVEVTGSVLVGAGEIGVRHGEVEVPVSMSAFRFTEGDTDATGVQYLVATDEMSNDSSVSAGVAFAKAPLLLPVGANLVRVSLTAATANATDPCQLRVRRVNMSTGALTDIVLVANDALAIATEVSSDVDHIIQTGYTYHLSLSKENGTHNGSWYGCSFVYSNPV